MTMDDNEDRISALPDCLLQHILYFLPSTEEASRTGILSKRWQNQWTQVRVLIFDFYSGMSSDDSLDQEFARFIDNVLLQHDCSKIKKLHLGYNFEKDTNFSEKIRFATRKYVEKLILNCYSDSCEPYTLPKFLFDNASLVELEINNCYFMDAWSINWGSLKALKMEGSTCDMLDANFLSGSPSLELLEVNPYGGSGYVIASKSLKILVLVELIIDNDSDIKISCPNLEELSFKSSILPDKVIKNVVSSCPLLRSLEIEDTHFEKLVIASKSLKKLVLIDLNETCAIEISCPNLEEFDSYDYDYETFESMNVPSQYEGCHEVKANQIFEQLQNVKELTMASLFIKILSNVEMRGLSYLWSNNKSLTLNGPNFEHSPGIVCALRSSPMLKRLFIKLWVYEDRMTEDLLDLNDSRENYWNSNLIVSNCLVSHLRTVKIVGLSKRDAKRNLVLNFIEFLLKNAVVLEKLVVMISKDGGKDFAFTVSQKVSSFRRCSQHATVELLCC